METLRLIVCGGTSELIHALKEPVNYESYAWNQKYSFSCVHVQSVDEVDSGLLAVAHLVILGPSAAPASDISAYKTRPVVAMANAPKASYASLEGQEWFYGVVAMDGLIEVILTRSLAPLHIIWSTEANAFTERGALAVRRAFWMLDRDVDGLLNRDELLGWAHLAVSSTISLAEFMTWLYRHAAAVEGGAEDGAAQRSSRKGELSQTEFHALLMSWIRAGDVTSVWGTLHNTGIFPDGLPYSWYDLHSMRRHPNTNTYLSHHAIHFFRNMYKLGRCRFVDDMWEVSPGCPWAHISGLPSSRIHVDRFIECWKYMAITQRDTVVKYARYWGYKGEAGQLFTQRNSRTHREVGEPLPNTLIALVIGSPQCGRRNLMYTLTATELDDACELPSAQEEDARYVRTTTFFALENGVEMAQTVVYVKVPEAELLAQLVDPEKNQHVDAVLMCYDGSDTFYSSLYWTEKYTQIRQSTASCDRLPFIVIMTKADRPPRSEEFSESKFTENFCRAHSLLWPPVVTSTKYADDTQTMSINEYVYAASRDPDIAVASPPVTPLRFLRRVLIIAGAVMALSSVVRALARRRRK